MKALAVARAIALPLLAGMSIGAGATGAANTSNASNSYEFRLVADTSETSPYTGLHYPSINNKGDVAFGANRKMDDGSIVTGIFSTRGEATIPIFISDQRDPPPGVPSDAVGNPSINDAGTVAFRGIVDSSPGVYTGDGGSLAPIAIGEYFSVTLNNQGKVSFAGTNPDTPVHSVFTGTRGGISRIDEGGIPYINNNGTVAYYRDAQIFIGNGEVTPVVATPLRYDTLVINNAGTVAYSTDLSFPFTKEEYPDLINAVYKVDRSEVTKIVDDSGPFAWFREVTMNSSGRLAFLAMLDSDIYGIFTGPDPVADKIIALGDPLFGSTVTFLGHSKQGVNDKGELAFFALLADGRGVVVVASPHGGTGGSVLQSPF